MAVRKIAHPSVDGRKAEGLETRDRASLSSQRYAGQDEQDYQEFVKAVQSGPA